MVVTLTQAAVEVGVKAGTFGKYWNYGCSKEKSFDMARELNFWAKRQRVEQSANAESLLTKEGFQAAVKRICPEINTKGRGRPRKNA